MPEFIAVFVQHTTPFYDDSYALNSANNGPYGDAITRELIPEVDRRFRTIAAPYARVLTGGSTGGWNVLALQIHYPDVFGGAWPLYPDQLDFRNYQFGDIYADTNAFVQGDGSWMPREVPSSRTPEGLTELTVREENQAELVIASRGRSGGQWDGWQAAWAPVGAGGRRWAPTAIPGHCGTTWTTTSSTSACTASRPFSRAPRRRARGRSTPVPSSTAGRSSRTDGSRGRTRSSSGS